MGDERVSEGVADDPLGQASPLYRLPQGLPNKRFQISSKPKCLEMNVSDFTGKTHKKARFYLSSVEQAGTLRNVGKLSLKTNSLETSEYTQRCLPGEVCRVQR